MILRVPNRSISFPRRPLLMGIVNINDDSFSGDGTLDPQIAAEIAREQVKEGADIIDIGAESARTNRQAISIEEEVLRLKQFFAAWNQLEFEPADEEQVFPPLLSVNTWRHEVVEQIVDAGFDILNDMSALPDERNALICAQHDIALLIMHSVGEPKIPHTHQQWSNLMESMTTFFKEKVSIAQNAGLQNDQIILDPGIDFAKQRDDNLLLLKNLSRVTRLGFPVLLPISRKTVIGEVLDLPEPSMRDAGTIALLTHGAMNGASLFRVHNIRSNWEALRSLSPLIKPPSSLKIILNFAITADGKISTASKQATPFTSKKDLERLHQIRNEADAILVGRGTLEADQMTLKATEHSPWRCVISRSGDFDPDHPLFHSQGGPRHLIIDSESKIPSLPAEVHRCSLTGWIQTLRDTPFINTLLCEGGGELVRTLFDEDLVDEINLTWAPHTLLGSAEAPSITGILGSHLRQTRSYHLVEMQPAGPGEVFLRYRKQ